jgi:hypothetical protein
LSYLPPPCGSLARRRALLGPIANSVGGFGALLPGEAQLTVEIAGEIGK